MPAMEDVVSPTSDGATHGFLFADLRGYVRLVETHGAVEASHLLERYRAIVRKVVARDGGAEIKTEGDSFYVVLQSASAAVRCGLDLLAACKEPADGGEAIDVGIGIHAGESVAHQGGFVGSAINIASRICAAAGPGQLLASETIRELTRSIVPAKFVFAGRRQLKGLAEPVALYRVVPEGAAIAVDRQWRDRAPAGRRVPWLVIAIVAIAAVTTGAVISLLQLPAGGPSGSATPTLGPATPTIGSSPSASQLGSSPSVLIAHLPEGAIQVPPGTYAPNFNRDVTSVSVPDSGWWVAADNADLLYFEKPLRVSGVGLARISVVYTGPCATDLTRLIGESPSKLIEWVQTSPQFEASQPRSVIDLGRSGIGIDATVRPIQAGTCGGFIPRNAMLWAVSGGAWTPNTGTRISFEALDDGPRTLTVVFAAPDADMLSAFENSSARVLLASMVLAP
jgi:class 3 adenylate cyclase